MIGPAIVAHRTRKGRTPRPLATLPEDSSEPDALKSQMRALKFVTSCGGKSDKEGVYLPHVEKAHTNGFVDSRSRKIIPFGPLIKALVGSTDIFAIVATAGELYTFYVYANVDGKEMRVALDNVGLDEAGGHVAPTYKTTVVCDVIHFLTGKQLPLDEVIGATMLIANKVDDGWDFVISRN